MWSLSHIKIFTAFSSFPLIIKICSAADVIYGEGEDGENFLEKLIYGQNMDKKPELLYFTAPYKLCEGSCEDEGNLEFAFPLYIGKRGLDAYKTIYDRDFTKIDDKFTEIAPFTKPEYLRTTPWVIHHTETSTCPTLNPEDCITSSTTIATTTDKEDNRYKTSSTLFPIIWRSLRRQ